MGRTRNFGDVIRTKMANDPALAKAVERELFNAEIAQKVYDARVAANLTQKQLAEKIGTQQSVISRIEDADYDGHSLATLYKIGEALGLRLRVDFQGTLTRKRAPIPKKSAPLKSKVATAASR